MKVMYLETITVASGKLLQVTSSSHIVTVIMLIVDFTASDLNPCRNYFRRHRRKVFFSTERIILSMAVVILKLVLEC